jgi:hypothetical protein
MIEKSILEGNLKSPIMLKKNNSKEALSDP